MGGAVRQGKDAAGGTIAAGSNDVIVNGSPLARIGDAVSGHAPGAHAGPTMSEGSPNVIVNSIPACRAGDKASCGHAASGSPDVIIN
jgi:uncharacterized Zn-binding protein involved in type VI secretion